MYDDILVPTDGSEGTDRVLDHAVEVAAEGATVHGLYVVDREVYLATAKEDQDAVIEELRTEGERAVDAVADAAGAAGLDAETAVVDGVPHRAVLEYVDEAAIDLVVMGTHGRSGRDRVVMGSVTERVVGSADVPVLTVRIGED
ncbi:MAG: universal stress protein [Halobacteriaceae archaeon]